MRRLLLSAGLAAFGFFAVFGVPGWRANAALYGVPAPNAQLEFVLQCVTALLPVVIANYPGLTQMATVITDLIALLRKLNAVDWQAVAEAQKKSAGGM